MKIYFDEQTHTYTDDSNRTYTSVSRVLDRYKKPFMKDFVAKRVANKRGIPVEDVIAEWDAKNEVAILWGNTVHKYLECRLNDTLPEAQNDALEDMYVQVRGIIPEDVQIATERIVASPKHKIAGTIDLVTVKGKKATIWDFKTNDLTKKGYNKMLAPLDHLKDDKMTLYTLQLSLYARLLEGEGYTIDGLNLININGGVEVIPVEYLEDEIEMILNG